MLFFVDRECALIAVENTGFAIYPARPLEQSVVGMARHLGNVRARWWNVGPTSRALTHHVAVLLLPTYMKHIWTLLDCLFPKVWALRTTFTILYTIKSKALYPVNHFVKNMVRFYPLYHPRYFVIANVANKSYPPAAISSLNRSTLATKTIAAYLFFSLRGMGGGSQCSRIVVDKHHLSQSTRYCRISRNKRAWLWRTCLHSLKVNCKRFRGRTFCHWQPDLRDGTSTEWRHSLYPPQTTKDIPTYLTL